MSAPVDNILNAAPDAIPGVTTTKKPLCKSDLKASSASAGNNSSSKAAARAHFSFETTRWLIMARTFLDKHYDQRINSAQTKIYFIAESFNGGFFMPAALLVGEEKDIIFGPYSQQSE